MAMLGLILVFGGLGVLCRLLFALATYAVPVFAGLSAGALAFRSGAGYGGALLLALAARAATFALGKFAFAAAHTPALRTLVGAAFALPAAFAGFQATAALARLAVTSNALSLAFGCFGAVSVGMTAWLRLSGVGCPPARAGRSVESPGSSGADRRG